MKEDDSIAFSRGSSYIIDRVEPYEKYNNYWLLDNQGQSHGMELPDMDEYFEVN